MSCRSVDDDSKSYVYHVPLKVAKKETTAVYIGPPRYPVDGSG